MSTHVKHNPDGTLELAGSAYRIDDSDRPHCQVIRVEDGQRMGSFTLEERAKERWIAHVEAPPGAPTAIVTTIADAWSAPRSPVPIQ